MPAPATILKESLKGTGCPGWAAMVETLIPSHWGCCRSSGRRQRSEADARIPRVGGRCRNVARAITTHRFGLWAGYSQVILPLGRDSPKQPPYGPG